MAITCRQLEDSYLEFVKVHSNEPKVLKMNITAFENFFYQEFRRIPYGNSRDGKYAFKFNSAVFVPDDSLLGDSFSFGVE